MEILLVSLNAMFLLMVLQRIVFGLFETKLRGPWSTQKEDMEAYARLWSSTSSTDGGDRW